MTYKYDIQCICTMYIIHVCNVHCLTLSNFNAETLLLQACHINSSCTCVTPTHVHKASIRVNLFYCYAVKVITKPVAFMIIKNHKRYSVFNAFYTFYTDGCIAILRYIHGGTSKFCSVQYIQYDLPLAMR